MYLQVQPKMRKHYFLDTTIFLATDLTSYLKTISLWGFFLETYGNPFFGKDLIPASTKEFSVQWQLHSFLQVGTFSETS